MAAALILLHCHTYCRQYRLRQPLFEIDTASPIFVRYYYAAIVEFYFVSSTPFRHFTLLLFVTRYHVTAVSLFLSLPRQYVTVSSYCRFHFTAIYFRLLMFLQSCP